VINDLAAIAAGALAVGAEGLEELAPGTALAGAPRAVIGVGTGLGVALAVPCGEQWRVVATEGGHRDLAATDEEEWRVVQSLQRSHGHASAETALSGLGLVELYRALGELHGGAEEIADASEIDRRARAGEPLAARTLSRFSGWLGAFAGDLALSAGARGGVYLAGGVLPHLLDLIDRDLFHRRFSAKGRFEPWLRAIPVRLILQPDVALLGCARVAEGAVMV
jgi:glucokinase